MYMKWCGVKRRIVIRRDTNKRYLFFIGHYKKQKFGAKRYLIKTYYRGNR